MIKRIHYWLDARRCTCRGYPRRFAGGTVEINGIVHRTDGPCYWADQVAQA